MKKNVSILFLLLCVGVFAQGEMKFSAKVENRRNDSLVIKSQAGVVKVLKSDAKGNFKSVTFAVKPDFYQITDGAGVAVLYLREGIDLNMKMDAKNVIETVAFTGKGEKENNLLATFNRNNKAFGLKAETVKDPLVLNKLIDELLAGMEKQLEDPTLDKGFQSIISQQVKAQRQQVAGEIEKAGKTAKMVGQPSPSFAYENHKGGITKLEDLKGKYVYIDVWATWCGPCRAEIPHLQKVEEDYHGKKIAFVSISIDEMKNHDKWKKMVDEKQMGGIQLFADNNWGSAFVQAFGINSIPRFLLIDPDGNVLSADAPRPSNPALRAEFDKLLK
ncbi:TlpA family protein disulfide reductase [Flavobacterium album]|uniref:TlpA family protein disulfide reductase n=1 Tax=Flavobacterium album TaxID=2175091 RepID=A0A2S1QUM8_9FLAO|nr:TlpA disulfide reductase family protein [Flavobacterium album]AWH84130.1 TlpA family protein disulfide reductase [Flavobacterium album]